MIPHHILQQVLRQCMATLHCFMVSLPEHLHVTALHALSPEAACLGKLVLHLEYVDTEDCPKIVAAASCMEGLHTVSMDHLRGSPIVPYMCGHLDKLPTMHVLHVHALDTTAQSALAQFLSTGARPYRCLLCTYQGLSCSQLTTHRSEYRARPS